MCFVWISEQTTLPPGNNPIAVNKYYYIIPYTALVYMARMEYVYYAVCSGCLTSLKGVMLNSTGVLAAALL